MQEHAIDYAIGKRTRFRRTCAARACWGTWKRWAAARRRHRQAPGLPRNAPPLRVHLAGKAENRPISASEHYFDEKRFPDFAERLTALEIGVQGHAHYGIDDYTRKWSRIVAALLPRPARG